MYRLPPFQSAVAVAARSVALTLSAVASLAAAAPPTTDVATAQPLVIVVPWGAGGALDGVAQGLAPVIEKSLGTKVLVINVPGNDAQDGHRAIQNAPTDGHTVGLITIESVVLGTKSADLAITGYQPLVQLASTAPVILLPAKSPFRSVGELLGYARANPGTLKASGSAFGGPWHLALAGLLSANGLAPQAVTWVPSAGAGPALQDLTAGALDFALMPAALAKPQLQAGTVSMLAVLSTTRMPGMATVPTVAQSGSVAYGFDYWIGLVGPPGITSVISTQLAVALTKAANDAAFTTALGGPGIFGLNVANSAAFSNTLATADTDLRRLVASVGSPQP